MDRKKVHSFWSTPTTIAYSPKMTPLAVTSMLKVTNEAVNTSF